MNSTTNSTTSRNTYDKKIPREPHPHPYTHTYTERFAKTTHVEGLPSDRRDILVEDRTRIKRTHSQIARVFQSIDRTLRSLNSQDKSKAFLGLIFDRAKSPKDSALFNDIETLKSLLPVFSRDFLSSLDQVAQGKTAKVLLEIDSQSVYKVIEIEDGLVGGTFPGKIRHRKEDNQILVSGCQNHSLINCLKAVLISNKQGMVLKTQIAGFTQDLGVVLKQPYIHNLEPLPLLEKGTNEVSKLLQKAIKEIGMLLVGDIGSPFAIAPAGNRLAIFDDLHGDNILLNQEKKPVLVDSLATRYLSTKEIELIKTCLTKKNNQTDLTSKELERILSYFDHKKLNGHLDLD